MMTTGYAVIHPSIPWQKKIFRHAPAGKKQTVFAVGWNLKKSNNFFPR
jgi:hypothetical protein